MHACAQQHRWWHVRWGKPLKKHSKGAQWLERNPHFKVPHGSRPSPHKGGTWNKNKWAGRMANNSWVPPHAVKRWQQDGWGGQQDGWDGYGAHGLQPWSMAVTAFQQAVTEPLMGAIQTLQACVDLQTCERKDRRALLRYSKSNSKSSRYAGAVHVYRKQNIVSFSCCVNPEVSCNL